MIVNQITSGGSGGSCTLTGDALVTDVLAGKTFYNNDPDTRLTGTLTAASIADGIVVTARDGSGYGTAVDHYGTAVEIAQYYCSTTVGAWKQLSTVTFKDVVTSIGPSAFYACTALVLTTLPATVTTLGSGAFYRCDSITTLTLPAGVTNIPATCFNLCVNMTTFDAPGVTSVTSVATSSAAFGGCTALTSVTLGSIGNPVTAIGVYAFYNCTQAGLTITIFVTPGSQPLASSPWGATSATIVYKSAVDGSDL